MALDVEDRDLLAALRAPSKAHFALAAGVMVALVFYIVACFIGQSYGAAFFSIPVFVGFIAGLFDPVRPYRASLYSLAVSLLLALLAWKEGVICILFSVPILLPMLVVGAFASSVVVRWVRGRRAQGGIGTFVILLGLAWQTLDGLFDEPSRHPLHVAASEIEIAAPPHDVFASLTSGELRVPRRWPWFIRVGLPMPERMRVEEPGAGGRIRFDFDQGTAFARVTEWNAPHVLAYGVERYAIHDLPFHITRLGKSPDYGLRAERVDDWLTIEDTRYELRSNTSGGTTLRRRIVWRRHLAPEVYFGWLQQLVVERGQARLLELVRERVERRPSRSPNESAEGSELHARADSSDIL